MFAGNLLLRKQFLNLQGLQDTLLSQMTEKFMVRASLNEMYILTINHFPYLLQTAVSKYYLLVMVIGFVLRTKSK